MKDLSALEALASRALDAQPLLAEVSVVLEKSRTMVIESRETVRAAHGALEVLLPVLGRLPSQSDIQVTLGSVNQLADKTHLLLNDLRAIASDRAVGALVSLEGRLDRFLRRAILYLAVFGIFLSLAFWGGYYASRRLLDARPTPADRSSEQPISGGRGR
jgi:hypothetical protein